MTDREAATRDFLLSRRHVATDRLVSTLLAHTDAALAAERARYEEVFRPITMQDVRLIAGEGKLSAQTVVDAVNGALRLRTISKTTREERVTVATVGAFEAGMEEGARDMRERAAKVAEARDEAALKTSMESDDQEVIHLCKAEGHSARQIAATIRALDPAAREDG